MLATFTLDDIQFLYPYWLILIPILLLLWEVWQFFLQRKQTQAEQWDHFIDPHLQPYVVSAYGQQPVNKRQQGLWALAALLAIVALAGLSLHKEERPVYQIQQGLVVALDLSTSMLAEDNRPNRMQRAKFKLIDLVNQRREGQTGLVVFAANAFSVSPLTTELSTLTAQVEHLTPNTMPAQGSRVDYAIEQSVQLLKQAGLETGHILLLTDGVADQKKTELAAKKALADNYTVSIISFGTKEGSVIPLANGDVLKNRQGQQVISRLEPLSLQKITQVGGGLYSEARIDNKDLEQLMVFYNKNNRLLKEKGQNNDDQQTLYHAINDGIWLLLPLIPLFLLLFRRGYLFIVLALVIAQPQPVYAFAWADLWLNDNQHGKQLLEQGRFAAAEKRFTDQQWQAVAAYRQGEYQRAQQLLATLDSADAWYNKGTALAQAGQLEEAVSALQNALKRQAEHQDAQYNLALLQQRLLAQSVAKLTQQGIKKTSLQAEQSVTNQQNNTANDRERKNEQQDKQQPTKANDAQSEDKQNVKPTPSEKSSQTNKNANPQRQQEQEDFKQQWLRAIPDDPSGLWRRKFKHQYQQRKQVDENEPW